MATTAILRDCRMSAQKARLVADQVRGLSVQRALDVLTFSNKKAAPIIHKLLNSALANAEHNDGLDVDTLRVHRIWVDVGSTQKRMQPRAKGRGCRILKRTCHIGIALIDEENEREN